MSKLKLKNLFRHLFGVLLSATLLASSAHADEVVHVAVAANFYATMNQLVEDFKSVNSGFEIRLSSGSSGGLYAQLVQGAPYDLFLSADMLRPGLLAEKGSVEGRPFYYATGQLAVFSSLDWVETDLTLLDAAIIDRIAIAEPGLAPFGFAAMQLLESDHHYAPLSNKLVRGSSVSQAFQYAASGNAELGIVSLAQIVQMQKSSDKAINFWVPPTASYDPVIQLGVAVTNNTNVDLLIDYLISERARAIINSNGYLTELESH